MTTAKERDELLAKHTCTVTMSMYEWRKILIAVKRDTVLFSAVIHHLSDGDLNPKKLPAEYVFGHLLYEPDEVFGGVTRG